MNTKFVITNGIILDGNEDMEPVSGKEIFVSDGKIEKISDAGSDNSGYEVIDLGGRYIMPGLINLHIHLPGNGYPKKKETDTKKLVKLMTSNGLLRAVLRKMCVDNAKTELYSGVTTVRTVGGVQNVDGMIRDEISAGKIVGPRMLVANMAVSVPGGHMAGSLAYEAHDTDEAIAYTREIIAGTPDLIKLMVTGGVLDATVKGEPGVLKMQPTLIKAACDTAHEAGLMVAAHVESTEGVIAALTNGADTIEHGAAANDEVIELYKKRNAATITTLSPALPYAFFDRAISHATELSQFNGKVVFDGIVDNARKCLENGIPVGLGTDTGCPFITHYDMWRELYYFCKFVGVDNRFALYSATKRNAQIARIDDITGTIEAGKQAEMIVTAKNPLDDIKALRSIDMVIMGRNVIDKPVIKKHPTVERELDKFL